MQEEQNDGQPHNPLGPDGLCMGCRYRRSQLATKNWLQAAQIVLVSGLPVAWLYCDVTTEWNLGVEWLTAYIAGILVFAAAALGLKLPQRSGGNGNDGGTKQ